ncbi:50S ribosomal protein L2 [Candidatus Roizmanbacteria bacterium RIFOXYB2_FULL_41_10]|uniref:Large ribosomal subunit protein uL2 n=1 Tax=Candidatus Roizmanbacteria bacterium RIFOXYA1_FULL_41_12 TaxID=1802082 RepID=A0A1F7K977_9BACT|nr:MAG: 50S ribosomal protein L2 [Candidatus Roizmanbacteria bacterium RIFOXYA1_FULL_41_12]OGK67875.1 MAG: 50S ribosomal protein L2 [Candidatus Roizmanbacteria bacterium RIFOXYB1_FULL_41_27]OGK68235.1 MAG: 50S ribosomal protein L2 [Candidatus Roizmanbacteria bacterium RIFOXYA2_FULL_41_8]OGK69202.1 MAG: 50S ribosomal protein L2 [Candidatus Roizmanbacteria bacterium RIFOXYB2_FULL_41_10]OGK72015.1 MAG: 50S ribosomal protein L2 [Candidatus Roizmanbacteria bacterium RIFOXYC1_FULL_41_16]OGK73005.1 M
MENLNRVTKKLKFIAPNRAARDNAGRVSVRSRGGRHKRYYRVIDWKRDKRDVWATVVAIEYDPNRSTEIALLKYSDGEYRYILEPLNLKVGDKVISSTDAPIKPGCTLALQLIPLGVEIHNIEMIAGRGGQMARSAGTACVIIGKDKQYAHLKLPSGEIRKVSLTCLATIGQLGNVERKNEELGKAGRSRLRGRRPKVRGVAMHPDSHPHGGGEGRSGEGMHPKTPWGKTAHGLKTRKKQKPSDKLIIKRRK